MNCRGAKWGCIDCKKVLHASMEAELTPIRERAAELEADPSRVTDALDAWGGEGAGRRVADDGRRENEDGALPRLRHFPSGG